MVNKIEIAEIQSPVGIFLAGTIDNKCCMFEFKHRKTISQIVEKKKKQYDAEFVYTENELHLQIKNQVDQYFEGELTEFSIPLDQQGTDFQISVWKELMKIPIGTTISYGELAKRVGRPKAVRAVGSANGANNIAIIIPCHRVIRSDGDLQGYGGGIDKKRKLIKHERKVVMSSNETEINNWF
jgi:O-6-methylguanine DNA methyltransferase